MKKLPLLAVIVALLIVGPAKAQRRARPTPTPQAEVSTPAPAPAESAPAPSRSILPVALPIVLFLLSLLVIAFLVQRWNQLHARYGHIAQERADLQSEFEQAVNVKIEAQRSQKEIEDAHQRLTDVHSHLEQEHSSLKSRAEAVSKVEAELRQTLEALEVAHHRLTAEHLQQGQEYSALRARLQGVIDADAEARRVLSEAKAAHEDAHAVLDSLRARASAERLQMEAERVQFQQETNTRRAQAETEIATLGHQIRALRLELAPLDEESHLRSFGFYRAHYDFADSQRYQVALDDIRRRQKALIKDNGAAVCTAQWTIDGSRAEGKKQTARLLKLILRAFNGECDAAVAKVKYNNIEVMEARIRKAHEAINHLVEPQRSFITHEYLHAKLEELYLVHEYQEKVQEEKEEQRRIRERMREEEIALRELEKARQDAEREETRYAEALQKAREEAERAVGDKQQKLLGQIELLQKRLDEAHANKERAIARAQMTRSGHVYVISNIGSFGENVYKIGMTRRLDPMERVRELGDASVPFQFDVHAVIYSEDAPTLETALHRAFHQRRVNLVNERKEFFKATIEEITEIVRTHRAEIEIVHIPEAKEYRQTLARIQDATPSKSLGSDGGTQP